MNWWIICSRGLCFFAKDPTHVSGVLHNVQHSSISFTSISTPSASPPQTPCCCLPCVNCPRFQVYGDLDPNPGLCDSRHQLFMASRTPIQSIPMILATNLKCHVDLRDTDPKCPNDQGHHFQVTGVCPKPLTRCNNSPPHLPNQTSPGGSSAYK